MQKQIGKNIIKIVFILMASFDITADIIKAERRNDRLKEKVSAVKRALLIFRDIVRRR